jgi:hypothetical protein
VINAGPPGGRQQPGQPLFADPFSIASQDPGTPGGPALLAPAGLATALGPDSWAAAAKTTTALHTE